VLYVENHHVFAERVCSTFLAGCEVTVTPSLSEARSALVGEAFDLVLVDYDLDDGKGATFVRELKAVDYDAWVVGASARPEGNEELRAAGADAICPKAEFDSLGEVLRGLGLALPEAEAG
jgi:DNA-binding response OmpR family regulator